MFFGSKITLPFVDLAKVLTVNEGAAKGSGSWLVLSRREGTFIGMSIFTLLDFLPGFISMIFLWRLFCRVSKRH